MARRSRDEWTRLVKESRESGMSQAAFCREQGVSVGARQYWIRKLREEGAESSESREIRLLPVDAVMPPAEEGVEVLLPSGVQLRFPPGTGASYVASVIAALVA